MFSLNGLRLAALAAALGMACGCMFLPQEEELLPPDLLQPEEITYKTMLVPKGSIKDVMIDICVAGSSTRYDLSFHNRSGYLTELNVLLGQTVEKGQVIARLDTDNLEMDIQRQRLSVERLRLSIQEAGAAPDISEYPALRARLDLRRAQIELKNLEDDMVRLRWDLDYFEEVTSRDLNNLSRDIQIKKLEIEKLELSIEEAGKGPDLSEYPVLYAELELEMALLTLRQLEDEFLKTTIVAPVDGEIVFINEYKIGEFVPGRRIVVTIADPTNMQFEYSGPNVRRIRHGMEADIIISGNPVPAKVSMTPNNAPLEEYDRYKDTIIFTPDNQEDLPESIRIGNRYEFNILLMEKHDVIVLPREAVSVFMGQYYVQVLDDGMRIERDLEVGIVTNREIEVVGGLSEDELIITGIER